MSPGLEVAVNSAPAWELAKCWIKAGFRRVVNPRSRSESGNRPKKSGRDPTRQTPRREQVASCVESQPLTGEVEIEDAYAVVRESSPHSRHVYSQGRVESLGETESGRVGKELVSESAHEPDRNGIHAWDSVNPA